MCRQHHEFSIKALEGSVPLETADGWFAYVATLDQGDDWTNETVWIKANPSLGVTVKVEDLRRQIDEAKEMPLSRTRSVGSGSTNGRSRSPDGWTWRSGPRVDHQQTRTGAT